MTSSITATPRRAQLHYSKIVHNEMQNYATFLFLFLKIAKVRKYFFLLGTGLSLVFDLLENTGCSAGIPSIILAVAGWWLLDVRCWMLVQNTLCFSHSSELRTQLKLQH